MEESTKQQIKDELNWNSSVTCDLIYISRNKIHIKEEYFPHSNFLDEKDTFPPRYKMKY